MILQEGDGPGGPPAHQPRRFARSISQAPEFATLKDRMQNALGRHVKGCGGPSGVIDPVHNALPVCVLHVDIHRFQTKL